MEADGASGSAVIVAGISHIVYPYEPLKSVAVKVKLSPLMDGGIGAGQ